MSCASNICTVSDDKHVWYCHGSCGKKFHATCVGVQRNHEQGILSYMLPLCNDCQKRFLLEINFEKFYDQQQETIRLNKVLIESNHKIAANLNKFNINEGFESMEALLIDLKSDLKVAAFTNNKTAADIAKHSAAVNELVARSQNGKHDDIAIKKHLTSLFDTSMQATKNSIANYIDELNKDLTRELKNICLEFEKVSSVVVDMAGHCSEHNASQVNLTSADIVDELKQLSCAVSSLEIRTTSSPPPETSPNLGAEMSAKAANTSDSGWRSLGERKVWKASWAEYDARQLRRVEQQKQADKARKRRKRNAVRNNNKSKTNPNGHRREPNSDPNNREHNDHNSFRRTVFGNRNKLNRHQEYKMLPPDKDLLAAAKVTFSNPPVGNLRGIRFQRGEILNPYPVDHEIPQPSTSSTANWSCGPALRNSFSQHCSSCSCERSCFRST